jgi:hypothetical protein
MLKAPYSLIIVGQGDKAVGGGYFVHAQEEVRDYASIKRFLLFNHKKNASLKYPCQGKRSVF